MWPIFIKGAVRLLFLFLRKLPRQKVLIQRYFPSDIKKFKPNWLLALVFIAQAAIEYIAFIACHGGA